MTVLTVIAATISGHQFFAELVPWVLAAAGAGIVAYERIVGRNIWRNVAEGRGEAMADLERRVAFLEAKVNVLQSEMGKEIAAIVIRELR